MTQETKFPTFGFTVEDGKYRYWRMPSTDRATWVEIEAEVFMQLTELQWRLSYENQLDEEQL